MFTDGRSRRGVFRAHCLLNQNAISDGTAEVPAAHLEILRTVLDARVGVVQLPCPELCCMGLDRGDPKGGERPVVAENTRCLLYTSTELGTGYSALWGGAAGRRRNHEGLDETMAAAAGAGGAAAAGGAALHRGQRQDVYKRQIYSIVAFSALPCISCRWKKPSYPSVWAGVSSAGSRALYSCLLYTSRCV